MSEVVWAKSLLPDPEAAISPYESEYYPGLPSPGNVRRIAMETARVPLPDPRVSRSVSRAAVLMASICLEAKSFLDPYLAEDPHSVGVYVAIENGPLDYASVQALREVKAESFAEKYRQLRNPKMYLKQLPNLAGAQTEIFLGIRGPMNVYTHSTMAGRQALEQAESDLEAGDVRVALVCTATGFEDPLAVMRACRESNGRPLSEGACAVVLAPNGARRTWSMGEPAPWYFGIGENIFYIANTYLREK